MTATDQTATVTQLRLVTGQPRSLAYRARETEPAACLPIARLAYAIEEQLGVLWDEQVSPYEVLAQFAPDVAAQAASLLDEVFAAADMVVEAREQTPLAECTSAVAMDRYDDAMFDLCSCLRRVRS